MRSSRNVFHLAIPTKNLDESLDFYTNKLGCKLARRYADRITLNFFGDQVVCHLNPRGITRKPSLYPRHFGITFRDLKEFNLTLNRAKQKKAKFFKKPFVRFKGKREEHRTFFLLDPSNNVLEFKYYFDAKMMY